MRNRYFLVSAAFLIYVTFFDHSRLISQWRLEGTIHDLQADKGEYARQIGTIQQEEKEISRDREKYAREHYYMKRANEDVYIIEE